MTNARSAGFQAIVRTPVAALGIHTRDGRLERVTLLPPSTAEQAAEDDAAARAATELRAYLNDPTHPFDMPIRLAGTAFQLRVWQALATLAPGVTLSYGALAERLGTSPRAVAGACRANPIPLYIPCHRIVAAHGLGGYAGATTGWRPALKRWLLDHERRA